MKVTDPHVTLQTEPFLRYDRNVVGGHLAESYLRQHCITPHQRCELDGLGATPVDPGFLASGLGIRLWLSGTVPLQIYRKCSLTDIAIELTRPNRECR
jgi:hypothetical protein